MLSIKDILKVLYNIFLIFHFAQYFILIILTRGLSKICFFGSPFLHIYITFICIEMVFVLICANHFNSIFEYYIRQLRRIFLSRGKRPKWMIEIAIERMNILFERAEMEFITHPERSHRYVELARKLSTKYNTKIPEKWSRRYCRECGKFLYYGHNSSVRLVDEKVNIFCGECGHVMKIPYNKEKKIKRRAKYESIKKRNDE